MNTTSVETEMSLINMGTLLKCMNSYSRYRLSTVNIKQLEGRTPEDVVQDTVLKVLEGVRSWENSKMDNFTHFMFGCLKSEISHILKRVENRGNVMWKVKDYLLGFDEKGIKFAVESNRYYLED